MIFTVRAMRAYGQNNAQTCRIKVTVPSWVCCWEKASCRLSENCTAASTNTPRCLLLGCPRAPSVSPHVAPVPLQASLNPVPSWGASGSFATWMCTHACANLSSRTQLIRSKRQTRKKRRFTDTGPHFTGFLVTCFFPLGKASRL